MSLCLFDLDNTLLDREAAFARWAHSFVKDHGLPHESLALLIQADGDGLKPRDQFFAEIREAFSMTVPVGALLEQYRLSYTDHFEVADETVEALRRLRSQGWRIGIVTNGPPSQQRKVDVTGLTGEVDAGAYRVWSARGSRSRESLRKRLASAASRLTAGW